jgi:two-component system chemotaxis response regulator CheV
MAKLTQHDKTLSEMEILEFKLGDQVFGVSVLKIEAIEQYDTARVTTIPTLPPEVIGTVLFRKRTIPLIDLATKLGVTSSAAQLPLDEQEEADGQSSEQVFLIIEFNKTTVAFIADGVSRIHRVQIGQINPLTVMLDSDSSLFTGSFNIEGREILIVDMERLVGEIVPEAGSDYTDASQLDHPNAELRSDVKIIIAEDSAITRTMMTDVLSQGNYTNVTTFRNGQAAYDAITALKQRAERDGQDIHELLSVVITDIEMPQMDGLELCRAVKDQLGLDIPVVLYSTLGGEEGGHKVQDAHADAFISKPQIVELVGMLDKLVLERMTAPAG